MNADQVFTQIRTLVDDDDVDFTTVEYLVPRVQGAMDWLILEALNNPNMGMLKAAVVIPNIAAGTQSLRSAGYFDTAGPNGSPLALMTEVMSIRERPSGGTRTEQDWIEMDPVPDLPSTQPTSFNRIYLWTYDDIKFLGADQALDLRVFGKFTPTLIVDGSTPVVPNTKLILAYRAAAVIATSRGNKDLGDDYKLEAKGLKDSMFADAIMNQQSMRVRMKPFRSVIFPFR